METRMKLPIRMLTLCTSLSVAATLTIAHGTAAVTVDLGPTKDNTLIETPVGNSNGAGDGIYAGKVGTLGNNTRRRGLLAFDLGSIPAGSTINAAVLKLEMVQSPNATGRSVGVHRVTADWGEAGSLGGGSGVAALPGDATWIYRFFNTVAWTTAGGTFVGGPSASQLVADLGPYEWSSAGLVADVQFWVDNAASNFGWLLLGDESVASTVKKFSSREGITPPVLSVDYTPAGAGVGPGPGGDGVWFAPPWPTPARGSVNLDYTLSHAARVSLLIHDAMGRVVRRLTVDAATPVGRHAVAWDGRNDAGSRTASGVYLATLIVDGRSYPRRIPMLR